MSSAAQRKNARASTAAFAARRRLQRTVPSAENVANKDLLMDSQKIVMMLEKLEANSTQMTFCQKKCFAKYNDKFLSGLVLLNKIEPELKYIKLVLDKRKQMIDFLLESSVNETQRKNINLRRIEKISKIEDVLVGIDKLPNNIFDTLKESIFKLKGSFSLLSSDTSEFMANVTLIFFSTHLMICDDQPESGLTPFIFKELISIDNCRLIFMGDSEKIKNAFQIMTNQANYTFQAESAYQKSRWLNLFEDHGMIRNRRRKAVFSTALKTQAEAEVDYQDFLDFHDLVTNTKQIKALIIKQEYQDAVKAIIDFKSTYDPSKIPESYQHLCAQVIEMEEDLLSRICDQLNSSVSTALRQSDSVKLNMLDCLLQLNRPDLAQDLYFSQQKTLLDYMLKNFLLNKKHSEFVFDVSAVFFERLNSVASFFKRIFTEKHFHYLNSWISDQLNEFVQIHHKNIFRNCIKTAQTARSVQILFESCEKLEENGIYQSCTLELALRQSIANTIENGYKKIIFWINRAVERSIKFETATQEFFQSQMPELAKLDVPELQEFAPGAKKPISKQAIQFLINLYTFKRDASKLDYYKLSDKPYEYTKDACENMIKCCEKVSPDSNDKNFVKTVLLPDVEDFYSAL